MPRPKSVTRRVQKDIGIDETLAVQVDLILYSEVEQRVPYGAWSKLVESLLKQWLEKAKEPSNA